MFEFDSKAYGPVVAELYDHHELCPLGPGRPNDSVRERLSSLSSNSLFQNSISDREMASCCLSALWLLHNFLDESHSISQEIHTTNGSYWHGIMHRREPDFSNAKYWFRKVGNHEVFSHLAEGAEQLAASHSSTNPFKSTAWDPFGFVDLCEAAIHSRSKNEQLCREVAQLEWQLLFDYCYKNACHS